MCTGICLKSRDNSIVYARTMEFAVDMQSSIIMLPRNFAYQGVAQENKQGLSWRGRYAVLGANAFALHEILDGVNERGLSGGLFYFPGYASYQHTSAQDAQNSIAPWQLMTWLLSNFATVQEIKHELLKIKVCNAIYGPWNQVPPVHAIVHDALGNSLVIEYVQGTLQLHDNPIGTFTNAPTFDWHMTNLNNYAHLQAFNAHSVTINSITLTPLGQGSGMFGIPGDFTSPSRFVRATALTKTILEPQDADDARKAAFHLLNLFDIPRGSIRAQENGKTLCEYTQWTVASDLTNKKYFWHTYDNSQIYCVDLMQMNLQNNQPITIAMNYPEKVVDLTTAAASNNHHQITA